MRFFKSMNLQIVTYSFLSKHENVCLPCVIRNPYPTNDKWNHPAVISKLYLKEKSVIFAERDKEVIQIPYLPNIMLITLLTLSLLI